MLTQNQIVALPDLTTIWHVRFGKILKYQIRKSPPHNHPYFFSESWCTGSPRWVPAVLPTLKDCTTDRAEAVRVARAQLNQMIIELRQKDAVLEKEQGAELLPFTEADCDGHLDRQGHVQEMKAFYGK